MFEIHLEKYPLFKRQHCLKQVYTALFTSVRKHIETKRADIISYTCKCKHR